MFNDTPSIQAILAETLVYHPEKTSVFLIGSTVPSHKRLSDTDLLLVPQCESLEDYIRHLNQAIKVRHSLNLLETKTSYDVFLLTRNIINLHLGCISAIFGTSSLTDKQAVFGPSVVYSPPILSLPGKRLRSKLYKAEAARLSHEYQNKLPVADTQKARQVAKILLRLLKIYICAMAPVNRIGNTEQRLFQIKELNPLKKELETLSGASIPIGKIFDEAMKADKISDWPAWMISQEDLVYGLAGLESKAVLKNTKERRLYENIVRIRHMLFADLRNILFERSNKSRRALISNYADETATIIVRLGYAGVSELLDFTATSTPSTVRRSSDIIINHLQEPRPSTECLAAAIVLLEFAFKCSIDKGVQLNK